MKLHRIKGLLNQNALDKETIFFAAAGSLNSLTLGMLAYPFGRIVIVDPDNLKEENVERHELPMSYVGQPKAVGMADALVKRGVPPDRIIPIVGYAEEALLSYTDASLVVMGIDKRRPKDLVNAICAKYDIPMIVGGVYPKGVGGQVMVLPRPRDVCYVCAESLMGGAYEEVLPHDYGVDPTQVDPDGQANQAIPALRAPIAAIASTMAQVALEILTSKGGEIKPYIIKQTFDWMSVLEMSPGPLFEVVNRFIRSLPALGMRPHWALGKLPNGWDVRVQRGIVQYALEQWSDCPLHAKPVSLDTI